MKLLHTYLHVFLRTPAIITGLSMLIFLCTINNESQGQNPVLNTRLNLPRQTTTVYSILNQISRETGYYFIYDSELVDNNRQVSIRRSRHELHQLLREILNDPALQYRVIQSHILIYKPGEPAPEVVIEDKEAVRESYFVVKGRLLDQASGNPLPFASVGIPERGIGISTNNDGFFQLKLPAELLDRSLRVSYMGYKSQELPLQLLKGTTMDILMETDYISMQEVIIRYYDPRRIIIQALEKRQQNYSQVPVYLMSFYREGVQRNNKYLNYSEAIFRIFKSPYTNPFAEDQVMMLKARNITDVNHNDTLILKLKAGVQSSLELDIIKHLPNFLDDAFLDKYDFFSADLLTKNNKNVFAIEFRQKEEISEPLFQGTLFIEKESLAIIEAEFELNPKYINRAQHWFFTGRSPSYTASLESASYSISFQEYNGRYHLSHVRGDLRMKFRRKNQLFSNTYTAFLEMAVCHIDDSNVHRFSRREVLRPHITFIDQGYQYDQDFWGEYNIITPEVHINEALSQMQSKIESFIEAD